MTERILIGPEPGTDPHVEISAGIDPVCEVTTTCTHEAAYYIQNHSCGTLFVCFCCLETSRQMFRNGWSVICEMCNDSFASFDALVTSVVERWW